jgi:hypothetical protein
MGCALQKDQHSPLGWNPVTGTSFRFVEKLNAKYGGIRPFSSNISIVPAGERGVKNKNPLPFQDAHISG